MYLIIFGNEHEMFKLYWFNFHTINEHHRKVLSYWDMLIVITVSSLIVAQNENEDLVTVIKSSPHI